MGLTTAPNLLPYPVRADSPDVPRDIQALAVAIEQLNAKYAACPYYGKPYVLSGGAITAGTGNAVNIALGVAMINGWRFPFAAATNLAMTPSTTNHVWLQMTVDGSGNYTGYQWVVNTTTAVPANAVYVGQVVEGASAPTTMTASFRGIIAPGGLIVRATANGLLGSAGDKMTISPVGDGVTPMRVDFTTPSVSTSGATGTLVYTKIWDGAGATGTQYGLTEANAPGPSYTIPWQMTARIPAFPGSKTLYCNLQNGSGTPQIDAYTGNPAIFEARWDF